MRIQPEHINRVVSAETIARLYEAGPRPEDDRLARAALRLARDPHVSTQIVAALSRVAEGVLVALTGLAVALYYPGLGGGNALALYVPIILLASLALPLMAQAFRLYSIHALLSPGPSISQLFGAWSLLFAGIAVVMLLAKAGSDYSRLWLLGWYMAGMSVLLIARSLTALLVRHWNGNGRFDRQAVIVGGGKPAADLIAALDGSPGKDVSVVGIFDDRDDSRSPSVVGDMPKLGNIAELVDLVRSARIDMLLITLPVTAEDRLLQILKRLWVLPVDIRLSAYMQKLHYRPRAYSYIGNVPFLDVIDKPLGDWGAILKTIEDKLIAAAALFLLAPLMALVALAVRLESKGPVLFKQKRYGFNNELIEVLKFRSMYHEMSDADAAKLVTRGDPRVTRVGRFIRKTSLDELPQFINVLRGDLSLVGPRPHATKAKAADRLYTDVVDGYFARHKVKPGITGWAQVNGWRGETDTMEKLQRRVDHDLYYIENWSLMLDLYILIRTPFSLLKSESAY